jgi:hypothetical protein
MLRHKGLRYLPWVNNITFGTKNISVNSNRFNFVSETKVVVPEEEIAVIDVCMRAPANTLSCHALL